MKNSKLLYFHVKFTKKKTLRTFQFQVADFFLYTNNSSLLSIKEHVIRLTNSHQSEIWRNLPLFLLIDKKYPIYLFQFWDVKNTVGPNGKNGKLIHRKFEFTLEVWKFITSGFWFPWISVTERTKSVEKKTFYRQSTWWIVTYKISSFRLPSTKDEDSFFYFGCRPWQ